MAVGSSPAPGARRITRPGGQRRAGEALGRLTGERPDPAPRLRALFLVAHPDDEVIGAGGRLAALDQPIVLHVTDGAPREASDAAAAGFENREQYAEARRQEARTALGLAGVGPGQIQCLELVDQEASTALAALARRVLIRLAALQPDILVTHPYEGGHPDHDAVAFAAHAAVRILDEGGVEPPALAEFTSYHIHRGNIRTGAFLPASRRIVAAALEDAERDRKRRMLESFTSQQGTLAQFQLEAEYFRLAPRYRFTRPPHRGRLFYEHFNWGFTGEEWRAAAAQALAELGLQEPL